MEVTNNNLTCINLLGSESPTYWYQISLPHKHCYPSDLDTQEKENIYATEFPQAPLEWYLDQESKEYRSTSIYWVSNKLEKISGISFKGFIKKENLGVRENEFAVFFHEKQHYDGGPEYGFVFPENAHEGYFYILTDANLANQQWRQWPGDLQLKKTSDETHLKKAFSKLKDEHYWNCKIEENGDFLIEVVNPKTWEKESSTIEKPDWFPNLYKKDGYITICAQKRKDPTVTPPPYLHIDEVKIWV